MTEAARRARRLLLVLRAPFALVVLGAGAYWGAQWIQHRADHVFETDARIASDMVSISSRVSGWVVELNVEQGDKISTGGVLVHIDARVARQKLKELKARIDEIGAEQKMTEAEISMIENRTRHRVEARRHRAKAGRSAVKAAKTRVDLLSSEYRRTRSLAGRKIVSQQRLETAEAALRDSRDRLSQEKAELAAAHGCDHPIIVSEENFGAKVRDITDGAGVPVVYDSVGKAPFHDSLDCLAPLGMMVLFGQSSGAVPPFEIATLGAKGSLFLTRPSLMAYNAKREALVASAAALFEVIAGGQVKIEINQTYALVDVVQAHTDLEARKATGSTVLLP